MNNNQKRVARRTFRYTYPRNAHPDQQIGEVEIPKRTDDEFQRPRPYSSCVLSSLLCVAAAVFASQEGGVLRRRGTAWMASGVGVSGVPSGGAGEAVAQANALRWLPSRAEPGFKRCFPPRTAEDRSRSFCAISDLPPAVLQAGHAPLTPAQNMVRAHHFEGSPDPQAPPK